MKYQFNDYNAHCFLEKPKSVKIGKWTISYLSFCKEKNQTKTPLLIIRGGFQKYDAFSALVKTLIDEYPIIIIELPGEGESKQNPLELEIEDFADLIKDFIDRLEIEKIVPIATSHGAFIAVSFAIRHPRRTHQLILGGITPSIREDLRLLLERSIFYAARNRKIESSILGLYSLINFEKIHLTGINDIIVRLIEHTLSNLAPSARLKHFDRTFKNIRTSLNGAPPCETLIFVGEYDRVTSPEECYQFGLRCPKCWFAIIKNSDHFLHLEKQKSVYTLYRSFLAGDSIVVAKSKLTDLKVYDDIHHIKLDDFDPPEYQERPLEAALIESNYHKHPCVVTKINQNECWVAMNDRIEFRNQIRVSKYYNSLPLAPFRRKINAYRIFWLMALERFFPSIIEYKLEIRNFNVNFEVIPINIQNNQVKCLFIHNNQKKYDILRDFIKSLSS